MFSDKQASKIMLDHAFEVSRMLNLSLLDTQSLATPEEFSAAKQSIGKCMAEVLFEVINPIIKRHPELAPPDWHR
ncbi:MAG: hypothetical protein JNJ55_03425 [Betaproteobacteria bacterium]|nr:hypothetical protein [Betaproteobacteria bacterium]